MTRLVLACVLLGLSCFLSLGASLRRPFVRDEPFYQAESEIFTYQGTQLAEWQQLPFSEPIVQVAIGDEPNSFFVLTGKSLWKWSSKGGGFQRIDVALKINVDTFTVVRRSRTSSPLIVLTSSSLYTCSSSSCTTISTSTIGSAHDLVRTRSGDLWIGTTLGLFYLPQGSSSLSKIPQVSAPVQAVAFDDISNTIVAGWDLLWRRLSDGQTWHFFRTPGIIDGNITSMDFDNNGTLWIGNNVCFNLQHADLTMQRIGAVDGLVTDNITSVAMSSFDSVWSGTRQGAMRYHKGKWRYYYGPRWLPSKDFSAGQTVFSVTAIDSAVDTGVIATDMGLAIIRWNQWTLAQKAEHYHKVVYPRHNRFGLVAGCSLKKFGDLRTYELQSDDNDGLWTSIYVASQAFRYAATKDPQAKQDGWNSFLAMQFLNNVTGIKGLMARSVLHQTVAPPYGTWHNSTVYPGWIWKGDTSSDEVTGHLFVYPLVYDLLAETPEEKQHAYNLIYDITSYIVDNGYYLIDVTGKPTTWGVWAPKYLNDDPKWYDERGLNSLQILSWLLSAYRITKEQKFLNAYNQLTTQYGYAVNVINQKITQPSDDNFSDDELAWLPYYTYVHASPNLMRTEFKLSIDRAYRVVISEHPSLWSMIYGAAGNEDFHLEDAIDTLRTWPLSQIDWPTQNSKRFDVRTNPDADRFGSKQLITLLPYDELDVFKWNSDPFDADGGSGYGEQDPSAWLLPYWMGRYHQFIQ